MMKLINRQKRLRSLSQQLTSANAGIGVVGALILFILGHRSPVTIPVPAQDLPPYHLVHPGDLIAKSFDPDELNPSILRDESAIPGHYTLKSFSKGRPIHGDLLGPAVDRNLLAGTTAIGIPATGAMILGGNIHAGDVVDVIIPTVPGLPRANSRPVLPDHVLVLDVKPTPGKEPAATSGAGEPYVVILAVPLSRRSSFAAHNPALPLTITRKL